MADYNVQGCNSKSTNRQSFSVNSNGASFYNFSSWYNWYWPTDSSRAKASEHCLFKELAGLPTEDPHRFKQWNVQLSGGRERFINTIVIDQAGLEVDSSKRTNVVLVNGLGAALGVFYKNLEPLSRSIPNVRIWAIDWLGMGRSGRPPFPEDPNRSTPIEGINYFLKAFEEWRKALSKLGLEKFILIGHSLGGYLAALYALRHPRRVQKLILASPAGLPPDNNSPDVEEAMGGTVAVTGQIVPSWLYFLWSNNYTPQWFLRKVGPIGPQLVKTYVQRRLPGLPDKERGIFSEYMYHVSAADGCGEYALGTLLKPGAWAREPLHNQLPDLVMPTTFIYGETDWMDYKHAEEIAARMTVATKIIRIPDCGHQLYLENPIAFNKVITEECQKL